MISLFVIPNSFRDPRCHGVLKQVQDDSVVQDGSVLSTVTFICVRRASFLISKNNSNFNAIRLKIIACECSCFHWIIHFAAKNIDKTRIGFICEMPRNKRSLMNGVIEYPNTSSFSPKVMIVGSPNLLMSMISQRSNIYCFR